MAEAAGLPEEAEDNLLSLLQAKDVPGLVEACADVPSPYREALLRLPQLYGGAEVLDRAVAELPALPALTVALDGLRHLLAGAPDLPFSIDLSDLRGYHYHNGVVFAAYCDGYPAAIALGARFDGAGKAFGRARPATGFSMDLREVARLVPTGKRVGAILAPHIGKEARLAAHIGAGANRVRSSLNCCRANLPAKARSATVTWPCLFRPLSFKIQDQLGQLTTQLEQNLRGAQIVKAFAQETAEMNRFEVENSKWFDLSQQSVRVQAANTPLLDLIANLGTVAILWYGGHLVIGGELTLGELVAFTTYLAMLIGPIRNMGRIIPMLAIAASAGERIFVILDTAAEIADAPNAQPLPRLRGRVQFDHVSFGYQPDHPILHDITFTAEPGQIVALMGATGSGKTLCIHTLLRPLFATNPPKCCLFLIDPMGNLSQDLLKWMASGRL